MYQQAQQQQNYIPEPVKEVVLTYQPIFSCIEYLAFVKEQGTHHIQNGKLLKDSLLMDVLCKFITSTDVLNESGNVKISERGKNFIEVLKEITTKYSYIHLNGDQKVMLIIQNQDLINYFVDIMKAVGINDYTRLDALYGVLNVILSGSLLDNKRNYTEQINFLLGLAFKYVIGSDFKNDVIESHKDQNEPAMDIDTIRTTLIDRIRQTSEAIKNAKPDDDFPVNVSYFPILNMMEDAVETLFNSLNK